MAIYIGVNGAVKEVVGGYIGYNGQVLPIYTGNKLPSGYLAVSHVRSSSSDISCDTNITPNIYTKIIYIGAPMYPGSNSTYCYWFKAGEYFKGGNYYTYGRYYPAGQIAYGSRSGSVDPELYGLSDFNEVNDKTKLTILNFNKNTNKESYLKTDGKNTFLFSNSSSAYDFGETLKICASPYHVCSYCVIYQNILNSASPTAEYFPAIRKSDGAAGLYNTVSRTFFTNSSMAAGPVINDYDLPDMS